VVVRAKRRALLVYVYILHLHAQSPPAMPPVPLVAASLHKLSTAPPTVIHSVLNTARLPPPAATTAVPLTAGLGAAAMTAAIGARPLPLAAHQSTAAGQPGVPASEALKAGPALTHRRPAADQAVQVHRLKLALSPPVSLEVVAPKTVQNADNLLTRQMKQNGRETIK